MRAIVMRTGQDPEVKDIDNSLEALQEIVGGETDLIPLANAVRAHMVMIVNKSLREKPLLGIPNRPATFFYSGVTSSYLSRRDPRVVCGSAMIVGVNEEGEFTDLTDHQLALIRIYSQAYLNWNPLAEVIE